MSVSVPRASGMDYHLVPVESVTELVAKLGKGVIETTVKAVAELQACEYERHCSELTESITNPWYFVQLFDLVPSVTELVFPTKIVCSEFEAGSVKIKSETSKLESYCIS